MSGQACSYRERERERDHLTISNLFLVGVTLKFEVENEVRRRNKKIEAAKF